MKKEWDSLRFVGMLTQLGIIMFIPILISVLLGIYLDRMFQKSPLFLAIFSFLGGGAALRNLYVYSIRQTRPRKKGSEEDD